MIRRAVSDRRRRGLEQRRRSPDLALVDIAEARIETVAHEMRAPLTAIVGALRLLDATDTPDTGPADAAHGEAHASEPASGAGREALLALAQSNAGRLARLVDDLLDPATRLSDELPIRVAPLDLRRIVHRLVTDAAGATTAKALTLAVQMPRRAIWVEGDADRLLQVVTNILDNAIRAAPPGSTIDVSLDRVGPRGDAAIIRIEDRGAGIPPALRPFLFTRAAQAVPDRAEGGHGLGLAVARSIVIRHGGQIGFEAREGGGTRFSIVLPLA